MHKAKVDMAQCLFRPIKPTKIGDAKHITPSTGSVNGAFVREYEQE